MAYKEFSYYYDYFNYNANYDALFRFIKSKAARYGVKDGIVCDLGCGTGELAFRFDKAGYDVIAVDNSDEMLDVLFDKRDEVGAYNIQILKQDITELDMFGTVDLFTCTFDTVNHLDGEKAVQKFFDKVSLFMHPDGVFIFDANTPYKHKYVLSCEKYDFDDDEAECIWQNTLYENEQKTEISIKIKDKVSGENYSEKFFEHYYEYSQLEEMIKNSGMVICECLDGETFEELKPKSQRFIFVCKKENR